MHWTAGAAAVLAVAGTVLVGQPGSALAGGTVLYAAAAPTGADSCADPADACDLGTALSDVAAGGVVELVTPGTTAHYVGNWTVATAGTSADQPVTIEPAPGVGRPTLDGNVGQSAGCTTATCAGPILDVGNLYLDVEGVWFVDGASRPELLSAGGVNNSAGGTVSLLRDTFRNNLAGYAGGAVSNASGGAGTMTITASTFADNHSGQLGGAVSSSTASAVGSLTVSDSTFTGNTAVSGGAIDANDSTGAATYGSQLVVTGSTFTGNSATQGGAVLVNADSATGTATISGSTFDNNSAAYTGGALFVFTNSGGGTATVTDSTFAHNVAGSIGGGAIESGVYGSGTTIVTGSTFWANHGSATDNGATISADDYGGGSEVALAADVIDGTCSWGQGSQPPTDGGYNVTTDGSCQAGGSGDVTDGTIHAELAPPASNGGPTRTVLPKPGSAAIGVIPDPTTVTLDSTQQQLCPTVDQRGYSSAPATACDAGAVQTSGTAPLPAWPAAVSGVTRPVAGGPAAYSIGVSGNRWSVLVTGPAGSTSTFTGSITVPAGRLLRLSTEGQGPRPVVTLRPRVITFALPDPGNVLGFRFTTGGNVRSITFTLDVNGQPATAGQISQGRPATEPAGPSPLTYTR